MREILTEASSEQEIIRRFDIYIYIIKPIKEEFFCVVLI